MIRLHDLSLSFDGQPVLKHCNFRVAPGERVAITGPSGCGKTTLINVIAGLLRPDSGSVEIGGTVSYVFQEPALFPWLTALENINVVLSDSPATYPEAERWLAEAGLAEWADKYPHQLSGGQKQRVALCRALAFGGDVLLLDEPLKGLDPETREKIADLIRRAWAGKTLLLVTHDPWEADALCDKRYTFENGTFI